MTKQSTEQQQALYTIQNQHKALLLQIERPEEVDSERVRIFLNTLAQAGAIIDNDEDRSLLHELIRYWSSLVNDKTGEFPVIQLQPFDLSLRAPGQLVSQDHSALPSFPPRIWNIPYPRNSFFTGRDDLLSRLHLQLQAGQATALSQPQAISGLGGIGKTQIAVEYAYRYHQDYQIVFWARAESQEALISSFVTLAHLLKLQERDEQDQAITVQAVKIWLQTHHQWLLILDNADDLALIPEFLPPTLGGHLLLTTRAWVLGRLAHRVEIDILSPEHGALLVLRRAGMLAADDILAQASARDRELALQISQKLGGLPLALDQVGAYLEETGMSLSEYQQVYQQHHAELLRERRGLVADHPEPVATTWLLSFAHVEKKNPAAADLLRLCAFLAPDAIPEEIITQGAGYLGPLLELVAGNAFLFGRAMEALRAYSLLGRDPSRKTLSVHRLVQAVLRDVMEASERQCWAERAIRAVKAALPAVEHENWSQWERILAHALACSGWIEEFGIHLPEATELLHLTGRYLTERARYREAEPLLEGAYLISKQKSSDLIQQGNHYFDRGDLLGAVARYEQAIALARERGEDNNELDALSSLVQAWGNIPDHQKQIEAATRLLSRARQLKRKDYEMRAALGLAEALADLDLRGRWRELKPLLLEGLATARHLGDHWYEVYHLRTLGNCAVRVGEEEQGFAWLQEGLNGIQPEMGNYQYYFRGQVYRDLSRLMRKRGEHTEAIQYAETAVGAFRDYGKPKFLAETQLTLAEAERAHGKRAEALRLINEVLVQARQKGWQGVVQQGEYLRGELERELGHADVGEVSARQAVALAQELKLKEEEVKCLLSLGQALTEQSRDEEAREMLQQARRLSQERDYEDHLNNAESLLMGVE